MNITIIKRRYFDFRQGATTLSPIIQFSNFLMLAYLTISEVIPIWLFAPLFVLAVLLSFTFVGNRFRKIQSPTDLNMGYEKSTEAAATVYQMMDGIKLATEANGGTITPEFLKRMEYMKKIEEGKI